MIAGLLAFGFAGWLAATPGQPCAPKKLPTVGTAARLHVSARGPGLVLMGGGTPVKAAFAWMHDILTGNATKRGGNVVVLTASPDDDWSPDVAGYARFASVRTVMIPPCATRAQVDALAGLVDTADAVFFSGGDQAHYVPWKGSALIRAVQRVYDRGGVVGGTSAGLAVQGAIVFDSVAADRVLPGDLDVATADAVRNPFERAISFTTHFLSFRALRDTVTGTHFAKRNRFGRLAAFMARALHDRLTSARVVYGLGVDERSALVVDRHGLATLLETPARGGYRTRGAYVLAGARAERIARGQPLRYTVRVTHLSTPGARYDLIRHRGSGSRYTVTVDGSKVPVYSRTPY